MMLGVDRSETSMGVAKTTLRGLGLGMAGLGDRANQNGRIIHDGAWAQQGSTDPAYPYTGGAAKYGQSWPTKINIPQYAASMAATTQELGQHANPVLNLYHWVPPAFTGGSVDVPVMIDIDGTPITPAGLIARSVEAIVNNEYYPWVPGIAPKLDAAGHPPAMRHWPNENYYNDNVIPGSLLSPEEMYAAAQSSGSTSTGPPPRGPDAMSDAAVQRKYMFDQLGQVPIERLPEAIMPYYRQSTYGQPAGKTFGGPAFPPVQWTDPFLQPGQPTSVTPPPPPVSVTPVSPTPAQNPMPVLTPSANGGPSSAPNPPTTWFSAPELPVGTQPPTQAVVNKPIATYSPLTPTGSMALTTYEPQATQQLPQQPQTQASAATASITDQAMNWVSANPLLAAGAALAVLFLFKGRD